MTLTATHRSMTLTGKEGELRFVKGQAILVLGAATKDRTWMIGMTQDGSKGRFPSKCVRRLADKQQQQQQQQQRRHPQPKRAVPAAPSANNGGGSSPSKRWGITPAAFAGYLKYFRAKSKSPVILL